MVPELGAPPWPTLGPQVVDFIESFLVHGPGDLRGKPVHLDDEKRALICRMYEIYPRDYPDREQRGRRRFKRCAISIRKGLAKTELGAMVAAVELHPDGPVRCDGFDADGEPVGRGVTDPYIPMVAYTEEQSEDLAYGALRVIIGQSKIADDFDIGLERILRKDGDGKAVALAAAPDARDGARTTFSLFDETHRWTLPRLRHAHRTMLANIPKRKISDAWSLEITTAPAPGEGSVAEDTMAYAKDIADGKVANPQLFFFHRQASERHNLTTREGVRAAVIEASGAAASWSDIDGITDQWNDPTADKVYLARVWLNQLNQANERAFNIEQWRANARAGYVVADGAAIVIGFDGSRYRDATAMIGTEVETSYQWVLGLWERPVGPDGAPLPGDWEVPEDDVRRVAAAAHARWRVVRMFVDPPYWESTVSYWVGEYGLERVTYWYTNRNPRKVAEAVAEFAAAIVRGDISQDGRPDFARHMGNACRRPIHEDGEDGRPLYLIEKDRKDSPNKMDAAMAAVLSRQAQLSAIADGEHVPEIRHASEAIAMNDDGSVTRLA